VIKEMKQAVSDADLQLKKYADIGEGEDGRC
jgi:hypothetical protein